MTQKNTRQYLVISTLGKDRSGIVEHLTQPVNDCGCNILDTRMTVLGGEFALMMLVDGNWNAVAKLETLLKPLGSQLALTIIAQRTEQRHPQTDLFPYSVNVVALDHPGIVNQLASFFAARDINIEDLYTDSYRAAHTGSPMFAVTMVVAIPSSISIARLRDEFLDFCESLNLDAMMEPVKG